MNSWADEQLMNLWWTDDEQMMNRWWTDDEQLMNWWWTAGLVWCATDYHRLPLTDWFYSIEHSKAISGWMAWLGLAWLGYIPDSTNYKSTASGAKNTLYMGSCGGPAAPLLGWEVVLSLLCKRLLKNTWTLVIFPFCGSHLYKLFWPKIFGYFWWQCLVWLVLISRWLMPGGSLFETFMGMVGGALQLMWFIGVCLTKSWNPAANFVFIVCSDRSSFPMITHIIETCWLATF